MNTSNHLEEMLTIKNKDDLMRDLWIWGTGNTAEMLQEGLKRWRRVDQVRGYVDSNPDKWGKLFYGKPIASPDDVANKENVCILICSNQINYLREVERKLISYGNLHWYLVDEFVLMDLKEQVLKAYQLFDEPKSRELYKYLVACKLKGEYPSEESGLLDIEHGYFYAPGFSEMDKEEVFVDVGCYVGDTVEEYLEIRGNMFKHIYSFEPDKVSFAQARRNIEKCCSKYDVSIDKITLLPYGVGQTSTDGAFERFEESLGSGSKFVDGKNTDDTDLIKIVALDEYLQESVSLIKADVESYEWQVLMGACEIISRQKPRLAICIYHNIFDFIQIPLLIRELSPNYKLLLRQQAASWCETIVYAIP